MNIISDDMWTALHIYLPYSCQDPFLKHMYNNIPNGIKAIDNHYFFLRYWQGGPHIRLRMLGLSPVEKNSFIEDCKMVAAEVISKEVEVEYLKSTVNQKVLASLEEEQTIPIQPIGSVLLKPYHPEFKKYGGNIGISIAERLFCQTSEAILSLLCRNAHISQSQKIGISVQIMMSAFLGYGMKINDIISFTRLYIKGWSEYFTKDYSALWKNQFTHSKLSIINRLESLMQNVEKNDAFYSIFYDTRYKLDTHQDEITDILSCNFPYIHSYHDVLNHLMFHFLHTTNNRLGLLPAQESFSAYLVAEALACTNN